MSDEANLQNSPPPASAATPPTPEHFYLANRMRVCTCVQCGEFFAVPARFFQQRERAKAEIFCPAGHANSAIEDIRNLGGVVRRMERELAQAGHDREMAVSALARVPAELLAVESGIDQDELEKRVRFIAAAADERRKCCQFCGVRLKNETQQRRHLRRNHLEQIRKLPASQFDVCV